MTKKELEKLKQTIDYFGHWYDVIGEEKVLILEKSIKYIAELEAQIERMKSQYDYAFNQLCKAREILCSMLSQYRDRKEIDYSTRECGEKLLKEGVCKNG